MTLKKLNVKTVCYIALIGAIAVRSAVAGIPVIDGTNLSETTVSALQNVAQTLKQVDEYTTQLQQYQNQLQNTTAPSQQIWDKAQVTIGNLLNATNTLNQYKTQLGSLDGYLQKSHDINYYKTSPCFTQTGCSPFQMAQLREQQQFASQSQKSANDAMFRGLDDQQANLQNDAAQLQRLQQGAKSADGQLAAIGYANELASHQSHQLLQMRGMMMAQQNALTTKMQADADKESQQAAASARFHTGTFKRTQPTQW